MDGRRAARRPARHSEPNAARQSSVDDDVGAGDDARHRADEEHRGVLPLLLPSPAACPSDRLRSSRRGCPRARPSRPWKVGRRTPPGVSGRVGIGPHRRV